MKLPVDATWQSHVYDRETFNVCCLVIACSRLVPSLFFSMFALVSACWHWALGAGALLADVAAAQMPQNQFYLRVNVCTYARECASTSRYISCTFVCVQQNIVT